MKKRIESYTYGKNRHTDIIQDKKYVYCWGFNIAQLLKMNSWYVKPVFRAVLRGLDAVGKSREKRVNDRKFYVWIGDFGDDFWCAIPARIYGRVLDRLHRFLKEVDGYTTLEMGTIPYIPLVPQFCYDHGEIGEYTDDSFWGKLYIDQDCDTGLRIRGRKWVSRESIEDNERMDRDLDRIAKRFHLSFRKEKDLKTIYDLYEIECRRKNRF